jgi:hypothetical protein
MNELDEMRKENEKKKGEGGGNDNRREVTEITFVLGRNTPRYKCLHLYQVGYPVQMLSLICTRCFVPVG